MVFLFLLCPIPRNLLTLKLETMLSKHTSGGMQRAAQTSQMVADLLSMVSIPTGHKPPGKQLTMTKHHT